MRNHLLLGMSGLVFISVLYFLSGSTNIVSLTGYFATDILRQTNSFFFIVSIMGIAGALAGYFTFLRRRN